MPTRIEWADETWNPVLGCYWASPGCDHCYAARMATRRLSPEWVGEGGRRLALSGMWSGACRLVERRLEVPARWKRPRLIFVSSMGDLFYQAVESLWIKQVFDVIRSLPRHTFVVLTKRPRRMAELSELLDWPENLWAGVSIEDQAHADRAITLGMMTGPVVRLVSAEPLLGPLDLLRVPAVEGRTVDVLRGGTWDMPAYGFVNHSGFRAIDWLIAGPEMGPGARPCDAEWLHSLRDHAVEAGVPFFLKRSPDGSHELDGRQWTEAPEGRA